MSESETTSASIKLESDKARRRGKARDGKRSLLLWALESISGTKVKKSSYEFPTWHEHVLNYTKYPSRQNYRESSAFLTLQCTADTPKGGHYLL